MKNYHIKNSDLNVSAIALGCMRIAGCDAKKGRYLSSFRIG